MRAATVLLLAAVVSGPARPKGSPAIQAPADGLAGSLNVGQAPDPYVGRFRHPLLELELSAIAGTYEGWLWIVGAVDPSSQLQGDRHHVSARQGPPGLVGYFDLNNRDYRFTGKLTKNGITLWLPIARTNDEIVWFLNEYKPIRYDLRRVTDPG